MTYNVFGGTLNPAQSIHVFIGAQNVEIHEETWSYGPK